MNNDVQPPFDTQAWLESMNEATAGFIRGLEPLAKVIQRTIRMLNKGLRPYVREFQRQGIIDGYPPQYSYRQTKRGRVPRLTPAMRAHKRELRERMRPR